MIFAYLFGSTTSGVTHPRSDVDLALYVDPAALQKAAGAAIEADLWLDVIGVACRALGRDDVDVVLLNRAPPRLADRVLRSGRLLFSRDEPRRIRWIVETKSRYCDLRPLRLLLDRVLVERTRTGGFGRPRG